jgi:hypothetical protein
MRELLRNIIAKAGSLGLPYSDIANAQEFLEHNEFGVCLDTIVTQLYEHDIKIDEEFYSLVLGAANEMKIPEKEIEYVRELLPPSE